MQSICNLPEKTLIGMELFKKQFAKEQRGNKANCMDLLSSKQPQEIDHLHSTHQRRRGVYDHRRDRSGAGAADHDRSDRQGPRFG